MKQWYTKKNYGFPQTYVGCILILVSWLFIPSVFETLKQLEKISLDFGNNILQIDLLHIITLANLNISYKYLI